MVENINAFTKRQIQKDKKVKINVVICDSTTFKYHRHGGGQKGVKMQKAEASVV